MSSFMKIAAMFVLSTPMALAGCMGDVDDAEQNEPAAQPLAGGDAQVTYSKQGPAEQISVTPVNPAGYSKHGVAQPCLAPPVACPAYSAPVTPAPTYPAPRFGAPKHEAPVYKAPAYELPTYQHAGEVPFTQAPRYEAPSYPGPTYQAPIYEAPIYEAPSFPAPIFERASYLQCTMLPPWQLSPCQPAQLISPCGEQEELSVGGQGLENVQTTLPGGEEERAISPDERGQGAMLGNDLEP